MWKFFVKVVGVFLVGIAAQVHSQQMAAFSPSNNTCQTKPRLTIEETEEAKVALEANKYPETATQILRYASSQLGCLEGKTDIQISFNILELKWGFTPIGNVTSVLSGIFGGFGNSLGTVRGRVIVEITLRSNGKEAVATATEEETTLFNPDTRTIHDDRTPLPIGGGWSRPENKVGAILLNKAISRALQTGLSQL